jgi:zinc protease
LSFAVSDEAESFSFTGNALAPDHDKLLSLAAEVLQRPRFAATTIQRKKIEWQRNLQQAKTDEDALLDQYFYRNIMKGHPYSFSHDFELGLTALSHITPESLQAYYDQSFIPNRTILFVYGDFKVAAMQKLIEHYFGGWQRKEVELNPFGVSENTATYNRIILVDKPDATHAKIKMGYSFYNQAFFEDKLRDKVALNIANQIFGGGDFESLLMNEIRVKRGYAYDIDSEITYLPLGGTFSVSTSVNPDKVFETVEAVRKIMTDLMAGKLKMSDAEVFKEINRFNALLPESYRDRDSLIWDTILNTEVKKRDKNYINQYIQLYNEVTAEKAEQAFTKYFFPEKLFTVIVGNKETVLPQLKEAGVTVELIEVR